MTDLYNTRFELKEVVLHPGDYFFSEEDIVISTILGSCISVAIIDRKRQRGGMNHFMLPSSSSSPSENILLGKSTRYGVHAMELLLNDFIKTGSRRSDLEAKVFGGGAMFEGRESGGNGLQNIQFAFRYLSDERIPVSASDTGEKVGRKIYFFPTSGKILLRKIRSVSRIVELQKQEQKFRDDISRKEDRDVVLF
jgi:chemotaxis protein CheD